MAASGESLLGIVIHFSSLAAFCCQGSSKDSHYDVILKNHLVAQSDLGCFESIIKTDEAMGEFGKPFNNELFAKKDYSKELNSGYFIQNDHLKIFNCRNIFHQFSIHRDH